MVILLSLPTTKKRPRNYFKDLLITLQVYMVNIVTVLSVIAMVTVYTTLVTRSPFRGWER